MPLVPFAGRQVNIDPVMVAEYLRSPNGPVMRKMLIVADEVKVATVQAMRSEFPKGFLGAKIVKRVNMASDGPHVLVGAENVKTRPHPIDGNPVLVFVPKGGGGVVFTRHVNHPGSDFGEYLGKKLLEALEAVGRKGIV